MQKVPIKRDILQPAVYMMLCQAFLQALANVFIRILPKHRVGCETVRYLPDNRFPVQLVLVIFFIRQFRFLFVDHLLDFR